MFTSLSVLFAAISRYAEVSPWSGGSAILWIESRNRANLKGSASFKLSNCFVLNNSMPQGSVMSFAFCIYLYKQSLPAPDMDSNTDEITVTAFSFMKANLVSKTMSMPFSANANQVAWKQMQRKVTFWKLKTEHDAIVSAYHANERLKALEKLTSWSSRLSEQFETLKL